jgi:hypothetical protein
VDVDPLDWNGVVIAESLADPTVLNTCAVYRVHISASELPVDDGSARWHLYWVRTDAAGIDGLATHMKHGWYAHFWAADTIRVIYDDARFDLVRSDRRTWQPAIEHGTRQGLRREWLDVPTDDGIGELEQ